MKGCLGQVDLWACLWGSVLIMSVSVGKPSLKAGGLGPGLIKKEEVSRVLASVCAFLLIPLLPVGVTD